MRLDPIATNDGHEGDGNGVEGIWLNGMRVSGKEVVCTGVDGRMLHGIRVSGKEGAGARVDSK